MESRLFALEMSPMVSIIHILFSFVNLALIVLIPVGLYFIIKLAIRNGINESKLFEKWHQERERKESDEFLRQYHQKIDDQNIDNQK